MGSTLIGHTQSIQNGDENQINQLNAKTNSLKTLTSTTSSTTTSVDLKQSQSYTNQLNPLQNANASIRNALGDIGNRIGLANVQSFVASNVALKKEAKIEIKEETKTVTKQTTIANELQIHDMKEEKMVEELAVATNSNNSCVMEEIEDDEEVEDDDDQYEDIDEDEEILDIDIVDAGNPQLASDYVKDVYVYLNKLEKEFRIQQNFLENKIVTPKMRSVLIDWLIQVHLKFQLLQETLYLCVWIIDAYLMAVDVPKMQLQLVGVTAMFVASKYEEMYVPAIDDFVYMTDNTYTRQEIRQMEISILKTLNFMLCKPLPLHFLRRFSKAGQAEAKHHTVAKYFMELSLHDSEFSSMDPSYLAACALNLSFKLFKGPKWNATLEYYSSYKHQTLYAGMQKIAKLTLKSMPVEYKYRAAVNKYAASKYMRASIAPELQSNFMKELAMGNFSVMN